MPPANDESSAEAMFDRALEVAEKHLAAAQAEGGMLGDYVAMAMIEAAVNAAAEGVGGPDVAEMLRDLADQIEADGDEDEDDDD